MKTLIEYHILSLHCLPKYMYLFYEFPEGYYGQQGPIFGILIMSLPTECRLLITFANSLDPDQARQNVGPDLDPNFLTL